MAVAPSAGHPRGRARRRCAERLAEWGIDTTGIVLGDGSGLSLDNRLTCAALLARAAARRARRHRSAPGSPVAGESGTLADIFVEHPVAGRLLGKTGTLNNPPFNDDPPAVKALAGYLPVDGGGAVEYVADPQRPDDLRSERVPAGLGRPRRRARHVSVRADPAELGPLR